MSCRVGRTLLALLALALPLRADEPLPAAEAGKARIDLHGDPLPEGAIARLGGACLRHESLGQRRFIFSPDGRTLVNCTDYSIRLWDSQTGKRLLELSRVANGFFNGVHFTPDGKHFIVSQMLLRKKNSVLVGVHDIKTGKSTRTWEVAQARPKTNWHPIPLSAGCGFLMIWDGGTLQLYDAITGQVCGQFKLPSALSYNSMLSRDRRRLLTIYRDKVVRWDVATSRQLSDHAFPQPNAGFRAHTADRSLFALHIPQTGGVIFWDPATGATKGKLEDPKLTAESSMAFTPDGKTLLTVHGTARSGQAIVWDVASGKRLRSFPVPAGVAEALVFAPDGKTFVLTTSRTTFSLWDMASGKARLHSPGHEDPLDALAFTPDGKILITGCRNDVRAWEAGTGRPLHAFTGRWARPQVAVLDERTLLATGPRDNQLRQYDLVTGKQLRSVPLSTPQGAFVSRMKPSADGKTVRVIRWTENVRSLHVHDLATGREREACLLGPGDPADALFADGAWLAGTVENFAGGKHSLGEPEWLVVKDWKQKRMLLRADLGGTVVAITEGRDGRAVAATSFTVTRNPGGNSQFHESAWQLWEMASGKLRLELRRECGQDISSTPYFSQVALSPDGRTAATAWGQKVELWDAVTGHPLLRRTADTTVSHLAFAPDGRTLATALDDGTALLWDVRAVVKRPHSAGRLSDRNAAACWEQLAGDAKPAYAALGRLLGDPERATALLRVRLKPAVPVSAARLGKLIAALDAAKHRERTAAMAELRSLGDRAVAALEVALAKKPTEEARRRIEQLLEAAWPVRTPEMLRGQRAVEVLERLGTPEARQLLEALARGAPGVRLTEEARAAVPRQRKRAAMP